jgi:hypothetical protein
MAQQLTALAQEKFSSTLQDLFDKLDSTFPEQTPALALARASPPTPAAFYAYAAGRLPLLKASSPDFFGAAGLFAGVDMQRLVRTPGVTPSSLAALWEYLNLLAFLSAVACGKTLALDVLDLQKPDAEASEPAAAPAAEPAAEPAAQPAGETATPNILEQIAHEVMDDITLPTTIDNPAAFIQSMMAPDGALPKIMSRLHNTLQPRLQSGELTEETLMKDILGLFTKLAGESGLGGEGGIAQLMPMLQQMGAGGDANPLAGMLSALSGAGSGGAGGTGGIAAALSGILGGAGDAGGANPLAGMLSALSGAGSGSATGGAGGIAAALSGLMGGGDKADAMPDVDDMKRNVRRAMRQLRQGVSPASDAAPKPASRTDVRARLRSRLEHRKRREEGGPTA